MRQSSTERIPVGLRGGRQPGEREVQSGAAPQQANEVVARAFREYNDSLVRYLSVRLHSVRDAEEVAQEAYARMLKLDDPDTISHLQAYLFRIASNIAVDRLRQAGRRPQHLCLDNLPEARQVPSSATDRVVEAMQQLNRVCQIIEELPPKCRKAFLLYKFEQQDYAEIAAQMQLSESMIRKYVRRAIVYCSARL